MEYNLPMKIYCSGIGGIGLSAYASLQKLSGHEVLGSDRSDSALLDDLRSQGIKVFLDQSGAAVPKGCDLFVYSEAIPPSAPEREKAEEYGIEQHSYPSAVGNLSRGKNLICVCGTHGKSSTTAMVARLLIETGKDPTVVVGTKLKELGGRNWRQGKSDLFVLEACEYRHSFHHYSPRIILLTTCDGDHYDFYKNKDEYIQSFVTFVQKLPEDGILITHLSDPDCKRVADEAGRTVVDADSLPMIRLQTPGKHMQRNSQLALSLAELLGIHLEDAIRAVSGYAGSWRRMEYKGKYQKGQPVVDDYAHHPVEIRATLQALKEQYAPRRLVCVFQPHTHDRTLKLYEDFTACFRDANLLIVTDVYEARKDIETGTVDMDAFITDIQKNSDTQVLKGGSLAAIAKILPSITTEADVIVCMGAGDITDLADKLVEKTRR